MNWRCIFPKTLARIIVAAVIALSLCFCMQSKAYATITLRAVMHSDLKIIDPIWTTAYMSSYYGYMVYDTLFAMDSKNTVHPQMVQDYEVSDDKLTYTFTLREGLKWHDGASVTSDDCIASIKRWGSKDSMGQKLMEFIDKFNVINSKTFAIKLKEPYGLVLASLAKPTANVPFIMPKRVADIPASEQITDYTGSGPFVFAFDEWKPGDVTVFKKFKDYVPRIEPADWGSGGKVVNVDRVEWLSIKDHQTAVNALIEGEVDYIESPPTELLPLFEREDNITTRTLDQLGNQFILRLNWLHPPFNNVKARRAVLAAIDQISFLQATIGNPKYYKECPAIFSCGSALATDKGTEILMKSDIKLANKLLAESGYDGRPIVLMHSTDVDILNNLGPVVADKLRSAGFNVDLQSMDWQTIVARRAKRDKPADGGWNIFMTALATADIMNPIVSVGLNASCDKAWFGWPCDARVERLRDQFARATSLEAQKSIATELQVRAMEIVTHAHGGQYYRPSSWRNDKLSDVIGGPFPIFWNLTKAK
ncbi:bacterial extracellular solute-binding s, 5 Middle family protein [Candidatus Endolissoclinum faulkneri L2]|uniref:Bacterial extracellular solute-binding s, 5 Middle family protein n=1 Tax=Candidatus Endolissoclinum faulkneri L2 TaxID=1193729 RepID=K7Z3F9_9PROT|nr:ABC transporter substrate-binding protein [Candidatus Endolissoclinum faulkneri]AFX98503.1 bacterial extracellular solute-binding s, 5 Middle family protein [Candidatus Endolissoclinum faulkneri L2]